jgi:hypothetical protein
MGSGGVNGADTGAGIASHSTSLGVRDILARSCVHVVDVDVHDYIAIGAQE